MVIVSNLILKIRRKIPLHNSRSYWVYSQNVQVIFLKMLKDYIIFCEIKIYIILTMKTSLIYSLLTSMVRNILSFWCSYLYLLPYLLQIYNSYKTRHWFLKVLSFHFFLPTSSNFYIMTAITFYEIILLLVIILLLFWWNYFILLFYCELGRPLQ